MGLTRLNPTHVGWVGLMWWVGLGWVEFFLTHHGGLGKKILLTRPNPTHAHPYVLLKTYLGLFSLNGLSYFYG